MADPLDNITDPAAAEADFLAGRAGFRPGQRVAIRPREGGDLIVVDSSEVESRLGSGFRLAGSEEVGHEIKRKKYGEGIGNEAAAVGLGALRGATIGLSDAAIRAVGGKEAGEAVGAIREMNPIASTGSEIVGAVAPALATGGGSTAVTGVAGAANVARGAGAARGVAATVARLTPAGAVARGGLAAERAIGTALGGSRAAQVAGQAAAGALEASLFAAGEGVTEVATSDQDVTAERVLLSVGRRVGPGAVLGGLATGGLGAAGAALGAGKRRAQAFAQKLAARTDDAALKAGGKAAQEAAEAGSVKVGGAKLANGSETATQSLARKATARKRLAQEQDETAGVFVDTVSQMSRASAPLDDIFSIANKKQTAKRLLKGHAAAPAEDVAASAVTTFRQLEEEVADLASQGSMIVGTSGGPAIGTLQKQMAEFGIEIEKAVARKAGDDLVVEVGGILDNVKRALGRAERRAGSGATPAHAISDAIADRLREPLRFHLEDEAVYGAMGKLQREINEEWVPRLMQEKAYRSRFLQPKHLRTEKLPGSASDKALVALGDSGKLDAFARGIGDVRSADAEANFVAGIEAQTRFYERAAELMGSDAATRAQVKQFRENADKALAQYNKIKQTRADADQFDEMLGFVGDIPKVGDTIAATASGFGSLMSLTSRAQGITGVQRAADSAGKGIAERVGNLGRRLRDGTKGGRSVLVAKGAASAASRRDEVERVYQVAREYEENPAAAVRRVLRTHDLERVAPQFSAAVAAKVAGAAQALSDVLPRDTDHSMIGHDPDDVPLLSDEEVDTVLAFAKAIEDPLSVVEDLEDGTLTFEAVEALREVYPRLYAEVQGQVVDMLSDLDEEPDYDTALQLGILFDLPTDPSLDPGYMQMVHGNAQAAAEQTQQGAVSPSRRSAPDTAADLETPSQARARRR